MSKKGNTNRKGEGQLYDKIMRENLLELFLPLVAEKLNFNFKKVTPLVDKQPSTVIRETDGFLLIETDSTIAPKFILHLEFESKDDPEMIYRIMEHHGIELRKYRLPIKHVVVYLGEPEPKMRTQLRKEEIFEGFMLVNAHRFAPKKWLEQDEPSKIIMAILGDYQKQNAEIILKAIIAKLRKVCKTKTQLKKFIKQLITPMAIGVRNLEQLTIKISKAMPITIDVEKDYLYQLGFQKAEAMLKAFKAKALEEKAKLTAKAAEKAKLVAKAEREKAKLAAKAEREKARLEAKATKAVEEKAKLAAKAEREKARLEAKAEREKAKATKAAEEKAKLAAKAEREKARLEAKAKTEKKTSISRMRSTKRFSDAEIMNFLNLDDATYTKYLAEIEAEQKED